MCYGNLIANMATKSSPLSKDLLADYMCACPLGYGGRNCSVQEGKVILYSGFISRVKLFEDSVFHELKHFCISHTL